MDRRPGHWGCCCEPPHTTARQQEPAGAAETPGAPTPPQSWAPLPAPSPRHPGREPSGDGQAQAPAPARPLLPPLQLGLAGPPGGPFASQGGGRRSPPTGPAPVHLSGRPISELKDGPRAPPLCTQPLVCGPTRKRGHSLDIQGLAFRTTTHLQSYGLIKMQKTVSHRHHLGQMWHLSWRRTFQVTIVNGSDTGHVKN